MTVTVADGCNGDGTIALRYGCQRYDGDNDGKRLEWNWRSAAGDTMESENTPAPKNAGARMAE